MTRIQRSLVSLLLVLAGLALFQVRTDREFINLAADEGVEAGVVLEAAATYRQTFIATRSTITRLGLFIRPHINNLPAAGIQVSLSQNDKPLVKQVINADLIAANGTTQLKFDPPLKTSIGQEVNVHLSVPAELDGAVRLQQRRPDSSFNIDNVSFFINAQKQAAPLGYQVYALYRPALAMQIGGLLLLTAIHLFLRNIYVYLFGAPALFALPVLFHAGPGLLVYAYGAVALASAYLFLRRQHLNHIPALVGANVFAFNTWLPLHLLAGRGIYALAALLPLAFTFLVDRAHLDRRRQRQLLIAAGLYVAVVIMLAAPLSWPAAAVGPASLRDIFLDPNQSIAAVKVPSASWDNFGSYIGLINMGLATIGLVWQTKRQRLLFSIGALGIVLAATPFSLSPHLIILATFSLACFAGFGLQGLQRFLNPSTHQLKPIVYLVIFIVASYALLDLWQVAAATFEYSLL